MSTHTTFILVNPQMGENIGFVARAMGNFALCDLRLVAPRDGWPNPAADAASSDALSSGFVNVQVFNTLAEAVADCHIVLATTARERAQAKPVYGAGEAATMCRAHAQSGLRTAIVFGPERAGLSNADVSHAHGVITFPVNPEFSSLNLGQAALLMGYSLYTAGQDEGALLPFVTDLGAPPAKHESIHSFITALTAMLEARNHFTPSHRAHMMQQNLQNLILRMELTEADVQTLFSVVKSLVKPL